MLTNDSMKYYLKNAFDYEIRNFIEIEIGRLKKLDERSQEEIDELEMLVFAKKHLTKRMEELKI